MNEANVFSLLGDAQRELALMGKMLKGITTSRDRLGDFIVAKSAAHRLIDRLEFLITAEQYDPAEYEPAVPVDSPRGKELLRRRGFEHTGMTDDKGREILRDMAADYPEPAEPAAPAQAHVLANHSEAEPAKTFLLNEQHQLPRGKKKPAADRRSTNANVQNTVHGHLDELILELLKFEPRTPVELQQAVNRKRAGTSISAIYQATSLLKKAGMIDSLHDTQDGRRKWHLKK